MHASYVTLAAKHRNLYFFLSTIVAEDLPCFDLGFQFLNIEKDDESDSQLHKISRTMQGLYTWVNKTDINFWQTQGRKPQKVQELRL